MPIEAIVKRRHWRKWYNKKCVYKKYDYQQQKVG